MNALHRWWLALWNWLKPLSTPEPLEPEALPQIYAKGLWGQNPQLSVEGTVESLRQSIHWNHPT